MPNQIVYFSTIHISVGQLLYYFQSAMAKNISSATSQLVNVFVYGTLKRGQPNNYWMTDATAGSPAKFLATGKMVREYPLVIATRYNVPFLLDQPGTGKIVQGEVFSVDADKLAHLDVLEEYPDFYTRKVLDIEIDQNFDQQDKVETIDQRGYEIFSYGVNFIFINV